MQVVGKGNRERRVPLDGGLRLPDVSERALDGLKFGVALPRRLAVATLAARSADVPAATYLLRQPTRLVVST